MKHSRRVPRERDLCAHPEDGDGLNPSLERAREARSCGSGYKDHMLCKQARRALDGAMSASAWAVDLGVSVVAVEPGSGSSLRVLVRWTAPVGVDAVLGVLRAKRAVLRAAVAAAISRRRVPELVFGPAPAEEVNDE